MRNVAKTGDTMWFDKFKAVYLDTSDANTQSAIRSSMRFPQSENVQKVLDMALTENVGPADTISVLAIAGRNQLKSDALYSWLEKNMLAITAKMPAYHIARMPEYVSSSCTEHNINLATAFYLSRMAKYDGMKRSYEVAMQESRQCLELKALNQQIFTDYLNTTRTKENTR
jgi:alanyl aminopeptidase